MVATTSSGSSRILANVQFLRMKYLSLNGVQRIISKTSLLVMRLFHCNDSDYISYEGMGGWIDGWDWDGYHRS